MIISVFKTSMEEKDLLDIEVMFGNIDDIIRWSTDLEDCDKILKVESHKYIADEVIDSLSKYGYWVEELEDFIPA
ncbi:hypothetical protein [Ekhidna sp.]